MAGKVDEVSLLIGLGPGAPVEESKRAAARALRLALEICEREVHRAVGPGAKIFVRRLEVRLRAGPRELAGPALPRTLGEELAAGVLALLRGQPSREGVLPPDDAEVAMFHSEAHLLAAFFAASASARGAGAFYFDDLRQRGPPLSQASAAGPLVLRAVLEQLGSWMSQAEARRALGSLPRAELEEAARVLPVSGWAGWARTAAFARGVEEPRAAAGDERRDQRSRGARADEERSSAALTAPVDATAEPALEVPDAIAAPGEARLPASAAGAAHVAQPARDALRTGEEEARSSAAAADARGNDAAEERGADGENSARQRPGDPSVSDFAGPFSTRYGRLFFLAGRVLEIGLGEHLYLAGILEDHFLAQVMRTLLRGAEDELAPALFGGLSPGSLPPLEPVADWAAEEVFKRSLAGLGTLLLRLRQPCPLDDELEEELALLAAPLEGWARHPDPRTATLLARSAAILARAFFARLGQPVDFDVLGDLLRADALIWLEPGRLRVRLPMAAISLPLRLGGLDFNPGWLPWLKRDLLIEFAAAEGEAL